MASPKEATDAASKGADLDRPARGEDASSESLEDARRWVLAYRHLVHLEQELMDHIAALIPTMPRDAQLEAEETNLPVILSQLERFRVRLDYWVRRERELDQG